MNKLNPFEATKRAALAKKEAETHKTRVANAKSLRKTHRKAQTDRRKRFNTLHNGLQESFRKAEEQWYKEENQAIESEEEEDDE
jgi:hypothetical protein